MCRKHGNFKENFKGFLLIFWGKNGGGGGIFDRILLSLKKQFRQMEKIRQKEKNASSPTPWHRE